MKGKTESGFEYEVNPRKIRDVRFVIAYKKAAQSQDSTDAVLLIPMILGEAQSEALYAHCEKDGVADAEDVWTEFGEIIDALSKDTETKN